MNDSSRVICGPRRARTRAARSPTIVIATTAVALLTACSGGGPSSAASSSSPHAGASTNTPSAVAYSVCMRSHGVPKYSDPDSSGHLTKGGAQQFGVSDAQFQAAQHACQELLPNTGGSFMQQFQNCIQGGVCPQALVQQALTLMRNLAQCLRSHGVPNWPDPTMGPGGAPIFNASEAGLSHQYTHSAGFVSKVNECQSQVGGSTGVPVPVG